MNFRIPFPKQASLTYIDSYLSVVRKVREMADSKILIDCSDTLELSTLSLCFLCGLLDLAREKNNELRIILPHNKKAAQTLRSVKLLAKNPGRPKFKIEERMLQVRQIEGNNSTYLDEMLTNLAFHLPISPHAKSSLIILVTELLTNVMDHSGETSCYVCIGGWGRSKNIHITFLDFGIGIPNSLRTRYTEYKKDQEAIRAILEKRLTVRKDRIGGMGYELIQNVLKTNEGRLHIFSGNAKSFLKYDKREYKFKEAREPFFGTCIDIQYRLKGKGFYETLPEISKEYF